MRSTPPPSLPTSVILESISRRLGGVYGALILVVFVLIVILSLYSLSSAVIEAFAAELVKRELIVEEHRELERVMPTPAEVMVAAGRGGICRIEHPEMWRASR